MDSLAFWLIAKAHHKTQRWKYLPRPAIFRLHW
jgi:hypothetical protein